MEIWVERSFENYKKLEKAFQQFGMPTFDMTQENFLNNQDMDVFTYGTPPVSIDILTELKGLDFSGAFEHSTIHNIENIKIRVLHLDDLIKAKKASGRLKDLDDIEKLKRG